MTLQEQIRANRRRSALVVVLFLALVVVVAAASYVFIGRAGAVGILAFGVAVTGAPSTTRLVRPESLRSPIVPAEETDAWAESAVISPWKSERPETVEVTLAVPSSALAVALTDVEAAETTDPSAG